MRSRILILIALGLVVSALALWASVISGKMAFWQGVGADWQEIIYADVPCDPDEWDNLIIFELRDQQGAVAARQEMTTTCRIVCGVSPGYNGECGSSVSPSAWGPSLTPGAYQVWFKPLWINESRGLEIVAHPPSFTDLDERGFRWLAEYSQPAAKKTILHLPLIQK